MVGAPLRGVRGRTDINGSDNSPGSSAIPLRTDATPSRPYPLHSWPTGQLINWSTCLCHFQVTGDGHRGIGHSGVGISAIGCRLRDPAAESRNEFPTANRLPPPPDMGRVGTASRHSCISFQVAGGFELKGELDDWLGGASLRSQVSAVGYQVRVSRFRFRFRFRYGGEIIP